CDQAISKLATNMLEGDDRWMYRMQKEGGRRSVRKGIQQDLDRRQLTKMSPVARANLWEGQRSKFGPTHLARLARGESGFRKVDFGMQTGITGRTAYSKKNAARGPYGSRESEKTVDGVVPHMNISPKPPPASFLEEDAVDVESGETDTDELDDHDNVVEAANSFLDVSPGTPKRQEEEKHISEDGANMSKDAEKSPPKRQLLRKAGDILDDSTQQLVTTAFSEVGHVSTTAFTRAADEPAATPTRTRVVDTASTTAFTEMGVETTGGPSGEEQNEAGGEPVATATKVGSNQLEEIALRWHILRSALLKGLHLRFAFRVDNGALAQLPAAERRDPYDMTDVRGESGKISRVKVEKETQGLVVRPWKKIYTPATGPETTGWAWAPFRGLQDLKAMDQAIENALKENAEGKQDLEEWTNAKENLYALDEWWSEYDLPRIVTENTRYKFGIPLKALPDQYFWAVVGFAMPQPFTSDEPEDLEGHFSRLLVGSVGASGIIRLLEKLPDGVSDRPYIYMDPFYDYDAAEQQVGEKQEPHLKLSTLKYDRMARWRLAEEKEKEFSLKTLAGKAAKLVAVVADLAAGAAG
ncbi:unnamed protein product, partial [Amoebophrya sp. A25]